MRQLLQDSLDREATAAAIAPWLGRHASGMSPEATKELAHTLEGAFRTMPSALAFLERMERQPTCGRAVAFATGEVLRYCFDENDLLPDHAFGILGLLDDAYLLHALATAVRRRYPYVDPGEAGYRLLDERTVRVVRSLLPAGIAEALDRTCESLLTVAGALFATGVPTGGAPDPVAPQLRVAEAMKALGEASASPSPPRR